MPRKTDKQKRLKESREALKRQGVREHVIEQIAACQDVPLHPGPYYELGASAPEVPQSSNTEADTVIPIRKKCDMNSNGMFKQLTSRPKSPQPGLLDNDKKDTSSPAPKPQL